MSGHSFPDTGLLGPRCRRRPGCLLEPGWPCSFVQGLLPQLPGWMQRRDGTLNHSSRVVVEMDLLDTDLGIVDRKLGLTVVNLVDHTGH